MVESIINDVTDGFSRPVYLINGQQPAPLIEANEDDTLEIFVKNDLPVETTIHWHGTLHLLLVRRSLLIRALQASFNAEHRIWMVCRVSPRLNCPSFAVSHSLQVANPCLSTLSPPEATSHIDSICRTSTVSTGITRISAPITMMRSAGL